MQGMAPRIAGTAAFALVSLAAVPAASAPPFDAPPQPGGAPVRLAQAHVFDVYVDGEGREIIVDSITGEVVEIRPPGALQDPYVTPDERRRALGRPDYDPADPFDARRRRQDREVDLGRREPPAGGYPDGVGIDAFPEAPAMRGRPAPPLDWGGGIERAPLGEPQPDGGAPREGEMASVPGEGGAQPRTETRQPQRIEPFRPDEHAITVPGARGASENVVKFQVLLDRAGASPGVIDGRMGGNVNKAIGAYEEITGHKLKTYDKDWIERELAASGGPAFTEYEITAQDAAGPYVASVPEDYGEKATLDRLGYTSVSEMLAERFHMDEDYLKSLNREADFNRPGTIIRVVSPGRPVKTEVARIVADKGRKQVRAYDADGRLVAAYPATIGSTDTPSPAGTHTVSRVAFDPEYTYNPGLNFKQGANDKVLTIPPGPNGPVGSIWIALDKPTYGVHGTPEPSKIGKTSSHGCVRLTNWDAQELAKIVKPGVTVEFVD